MSKTLKIPMDEIKINENTFNSPTWGELTFFPAKSSKWDDTCKHCLLARNTVECFMTNCRSYERTDFKNGYFSIHQMPNK